MSHLIIKKNIERLLKEKHWKVADVENKMGSRNITQIMRGTSKNPTIDVLQSIAREFNVEIQELLLDQDDNDDAIINITLLRDTCDKVIKELESINYPITIKYSNIFSLIQEMYGYSVKLGLNYADENYIKYTLHKLYKK